MSLFTEMEYKKVVICGDGKRNMSLFTFYINDMESKKIFTLCLHDDLLISQNTQMSRFTEMEYKKVGICGDGKQNMSLFTYDIKQMECENVVIYGDTAHSFRSQNTQMSLFTKME